MLTHVGNINLNHFTSLSKATLYVFMPGIKCKTATTVTMTNNCNIFLEKQLFIKWK